VLDEVRSSDQTGHGQERKHFCFGQGTEIGPAPDIAYFTNGCVITAGVDPERSGVGFQTANGSARALFSAVGRVAAVRIRGTVAPMLGVGWRRFSNGPTRTQSPLL